MGKNTGSNASYNPVTMNIGEARHTRRRLLNERRLITRGMFFSVIFAVGYCNMNMRPVI
jgi:hypothetical protein